MLINIDDVKTFPEEIHKYFSKNIKKIHLYYEEQRKIDENERKSRFPIVKIIKNQYNDDIDEIIDHVYKKTNRAF
ncbi:MAG: hypothetical protein K2X69_11890, partial [Silvanigrellaceae bacterium]|nr:hypothetical protein [Silvanigrellaceae bacterium]